MAGSVCRIHSPPSSWKFSAFCLSSVSTKISAPTLVSSETILETLASCASVACGLK